MRMKIERVEKLSRGCFFFFNNLIIKITFIEHFCLLTKPELMWAFSLTLLEFAHHCNTLGKEKDSFSAFYALLAI